MSKSIVVTFHSGEQDFNKLMSKIVLLKVTNEANLEKRNNNIHTTTIHKMR